MKMIKYNIATKVNTGTEESPEYTEVLSAVLLEYSEENELLAQREAYNGEYTIEDDGQPDPVPPVEDDVWAEMATALQEGVNSV